MARTRHARIMIPRLPLLAQAQGRRATAVCLHLLAAALSQAATFQVDIAHRDLATGLEIQDVQAGWTAWDVGDGVNPGRENDVTRSQQFAELGGFTATLINVDIRKRGDVDEENPLSALIEDAVKNSAVPDGTAFSLALAGLAPGSYEMTTYHHDANDPDGTLDIFVDPGSGFVQVADEVLQSFGADAFSEPATATFQFSAAPGADVTVDFRLGDDPGLNSELFLNGFELTQNPGSPGARTVRVDLGHRDQPDTPLEIQEVQPGWTPWDVGDGVAPGREDDVTRSQAFSEFGEFTATLAPVDVRKRADVDPANPLGALIEDCVKNGIVETDSAFTLSLSGLPAGTYEMTTYHHDSNDDIDGTVDIWVDAGAGFVQAVDELPQTNGATADVVPATATFQFVATAGTDVVIDFVLGDDPGFDFEVFLNGFELTWLDEPQPLLLEIAYAPPYIRLSWEGQALLQTSNSPEAGWQDVPGAMSPYLTEPVSTRQFFRLRAPR